MTASALAVHWRAVVLVFLPFAAGYYLTYLFRTINAVIASRLMADLGLGAADLGLLTSVFFLSLAAVQLPLGALLDRHGPRRIQLTLLPIAALGAALFASAGGLGALALGRALIGVGVSGSLMSGLKAIVLWFPRERIPLANGCFVMLGALGAVTAATPAESLLASLGWRGLFELLAIASAACAVLIYLFVPEPRSPSRFAPETRSEAQVSMPTKKRAGPWSVYRDRRFWRLAPLSTACIGSAWALHGLWSAPWLKDVEGLDQPAVVQHLFVMAVAACAGALLLGLAADRLRQRRGRFEGLLVVVAALFIAAQLALVLNWPVPTMLLWAVVAGAGAATVLSFSILTDHFPKEIAGQANAALNLLHVGGAFVLQSGFGLILAQWTAESGRYPPIAYRAAFLLNIVLQIAALLWFLRPDREARAAVCPTRRARVSPEFCSAFVGAQQLVARPLTDRLAKARRQASCWRLLALGSGALSFTLALTLVVSAGRAIAVPQMVAVDRLAAIDDSPKPKGAVRLPDAKIEFMLARFVEDVRSLSTDPVVVRSKWARAFDMTTDRGAETLKAHARVANPFAQIGTRPVIATVTSVVRTSDGSFEVHWKELSFDNEVPTRMERFTAIVRVAPTAPDSEKTLGKNPLDVYVDDIAWSHELARGQ